jgi:RNA methyltransferase
VVYFAIKTSACQLPNAAFSFMLLVRPLRFSTSMPNMNLLIFASMAMIGVSSMGMARKPQLKTAPKEGFHLRNKHRNRYDFQFLKSTNPELVSYVAVNKYGDESIEFSNPLAVTALNKVLL